MTTPIFYWPVEDGADSSYVASAPGTLMAVDR